MPIINIPGVGKVRFPNEMSDKDIVDAIENNILKRPADQSRTWGEAGVDLAAGLGKGLGQLAQVPGQIGMLSGLYKPEEEETGIQGLGKSLEQYSESQKSAGLKAKEAARAESIGAQTGIIDEARVALMSTVTDPALITSFFAEQVPNLIGSFGIGAVAKGGTKLLMRQATEQALQKAGLRSAIGGNAVMQGADIGSDTYEETLARLKQNQPDIDPQKAQELALGAGRKAAIEAATISLGTAYLPGGSTIERALVGRKLPGVGVTKGILGETLSEGLEEAGGAFAKNLSMSDVLPDVDLTKGVGAAGAFGALGGAMFGTPAALMGGRPTQQPAVRAATPQLEAAIQAPVEAPEQQTPPQVSTLTPSPLQNQIDRQQAEQQALQEQRRAQGARVAGLPGFTGMPDANQQIITQARADQAAQIKADESARKAAINRVMKTTFSADPVMQTIAQQRALEELGVPRAKANEITTADPTKQTELIEAEAPEFIPAEKGQKKPRGETLFEISPEDKQEIADRRSDLALVNKDLKEAQAGKGNLFSYLKGKLIDRPGAFSLADIDKDNKRLRQLYNTKGQGALLEDLVADGALDEYLPFGNRSTIEGFDPQTAIEYIAEKLRNGENINEESTVRLRDLQNQKEELKSRIEGLTSIPAANYELGQMAEQPREELTEAGLRDLEDDARFIGVDVDRLREELSDSMPSASIEEYKGAYQNALFAATSRDQRQDALYSRKGEAAPKADPVQAKMERELTGKSMIQAAQWAVNNAPNPFAKLTASKTLATLKELEARGVTFNFEVQGGKERSSLLSGAEGVTNFLWGREGTKVTVFLNGTPVFADQRGYPSGMTYDTLLHELLHVATRTSTKFLPPDHPLIKDLNELFNTVVRKYNADAKAGKLPPVLERYYKRINNVLATPDELISWGMNDKEFQKYLSEIKVGDKTVFSQLIDLVRKLIGMAKPFETALDRLVRTTEGLLELDTEYLQNEMVSQTYSLGKPAPVQKAKPVPMRQQALFQRSTPVMQDTLEVRREGFFFDAKNSPLYQKRSAEDIKYPTKEQTAAAIAKNATARKIMQDRGNVANGAYVGLRQDLNIKDANLLAVHQGKESLHEKGAGFFSGDVQTYLPVATLKNVYFKIRQTTREAIAEGREFKSKMGSADGQIVKTDQPNFDGIELRFNPFREHLFVDAMGRAVKYVDEATIVAGRAFARGNIEYYGEEDVPARAGTAPTAARLMGQGEGQIKPIIDEPSGNVSIEQQQSLFMQQAVIEDNLQKRAEGFYIRADQSPLYQSRSAAGMPQVTDDMFQRALAMHAKGARVEGKGSKIEPGDYVGVRLDVPIREASKKIFPPNGLPIQSIHKGTRSGIENSKGFFNNPVLKYAPNITIKNVHFKIDQAERAEIAAGRKKSPMGSADGQFVRIGEPNFDGIELGFNPKREHLFVDALGRAIKYADEITAMGDRVYARGMIEYYGEEDIPSAGAAPTRAGPMVLETAIQEPVLNAVPDTNDGRVSEGQQQSLFMQQGITRRGLFGLRPSAKLETATQEPKNGNMLESLMQTPVSRRTVLKSAVGTVMQNIVPNIPKEFIDLPKDSARVASTVDGYMFVEQPNGTWNSQSLFGDVDLKGLLDSFYDESYGGAQLSFGIVPKKMLELTEDGLLAINGNFYRSISKSLYPTTAASKYFNGWEEGPFEVPAQEPELTYKDLVKEAELAEAEAATGISARGTAAGSTQAQQKSQQGLFEEDSDAVALKNIKKDLVRYASGMSGLSDFETGAYARSGHKSSGVGVDVGLLSKNAIDSMAHAVVDFRVPVFVDSGAFGNFRQIIKGNQPKPLDFDAILSKYDDITNAIAEFNVAEDNDYPRPLFVMPDIVGNQRGSLDLIKKHKNWITGELTGNLSQPIIPIQKGGLTLAQAYQEVVDTLGRDDFIVGVPSNAKAVSRDDLIKFLREAQPKRVHFLGAAADAKLNPLLGVVAHVSPNTRVTADASKVRSSILDGVAKGKTRQQAIMDALYDAQDVAVAPYLSESLSKQAAPTPTPVGEQAMEILLGIGREPKAPEPGYIQRVRQSWDNAVDNPKATAQAAQSGFRRYADMIETYAFSSDAALNNQIRQAIMESTLGQEEKIGALMNVSLSQTVHSDAVSNLFLMKGDVRFNKKLSKWEGVDSEYNIVNLSKKLDEIAAKYGLTKEKIQLSSHTAFEAKRTKSLIQFNQQLADEAEKLNAMAEEELRNGEELKASVLREKASSLMGKTKFIHMKDEEINAGMAQFKLMPELSGAVDIWNSIRGNAVKTLVSSGLWTEAEADFLLSNADYVPFYREDQLEQGKGPKEFMRSLQVQAKERRLKGTDRPVNDIFDNMVRWTQYSINRAVRNRSAVALAQTAESVGLATRVRNKSDGDNVISVWQDGGEVFYNMEDPMFMQAFQGLESVSIPTIRWAAKVADVLRQSVVLYPLFSVSQIPQDSFAAMFSSGLKPQHALSIPFRAVKEFLLTLANKSKTHDELKNFGVVGVRDFTSAMVRNDAEVYAGLKAPPGLIGKIKNFLSHVAMASDNAVRQATYLAAQAQGLSQSESLEKAFEIFNVRRKGSSRMLAMAGQLIPFFNAYLAAQTVAYKTITGVGTSPTQRAEAYKVLFGTTASVMTLSVLYAMMNGDDDDYLNKPTPTRDRLLMIPGTGGMSLPLRSDLFTLPKVLAEHTYLLLTENGYEDGRKFRDSMTAVLANAFLSPTAVPQALKPLIEVGINYDFFQGKPLIGVFQKNLETERQFTDSTSELGKILGSTGIMSPIAIDHIARGMLGSFGGLVMYATNPFLWTLRGDQNVPRPDLSLQDALATIPNASGFISKEFESALRKDFYQLREATGKASSTLADLKQRSPEKIEDYITDEAVRNRLGLAPNVEGIARNLTSIRQAITRITNSEMPSNEKTREIRNLREAEREMLKGVNLKEMREFAKI